MSDNTTLNAGSGGDTIASDDIGGVKHQRVKLSLGADGSATDALGGAGAVTSGVQRVTLASDDPAVTDLAALEVLAGTIDADTSGIAAGYAAEGAALGSGVLVQGDDGTDRTNLAVDTDGHAQVDVLSSALPTGAATAAKQPALGTAGTPSADVISVQGVGGGTALPVSAASLPLPTGAATAANQTTANTSLATLAGAVNGTEMQVDVVGALPAGTNNIGDVDVLTLPNVTLAAGTNTNEVVGDAAHGAAVAGNPLLVGLEGRSTAPTAVDDGDVVRALASLLGRLVTLPYALPGSTWSYATANGGVTDTADDEAKAAVASTRHYVTSVQVINAHDSVATEVVIKDGSTVLWRGWAEQTGGGVSAKFDPPLRGTENTAINVANITNGSQTYFNLQGFSVTE